MITFKQLADDVAAQVWGFTPDRQVKPVHFANGFVRALFGQGGAPALLQKAAAGFRKGTPSVSTAALLVDMRDSYESDHQDNDIERATHLRAALDLVLSQDRALFARGPYSSLTLTHPLHTSRDPSDRGTGRFMAEVVAAIQGDAVGRILRTALLRATDNVYLLTLPLLPEREPGDPMLPRDETLEMLSSSPQLRAIQGAFTNLSCYEGRLEKTVFLQRVVSLGSFGILLHLMNRPTDDGVVFERDATPVLLCASPALPEIREASRAAFARARQRIERSFEAGVTRELRNRGEDNLSEKQYRELARSWVPELGQSSRDGRRDGKIWARFRQDFDGVLLGDWVTGQRRKTWKSGEEPQVIRSGGR